MYTLRGKGYSPNCMSLVWAACGVLLSGIQTLENYAGHHRCCLLHGAPAANHMLNVLMKLPEWNSTLKKCKQLFEYQRLLLLRDIW
jgi:hypothetical protein